MSSAMLYSFTGALLVLLGLLGLVLHQHLLRRLMAFNLMGSGCFLILVALSQHLALARDAVPQALVLTGIVVAVAATALALVLIRRWYRLTGLTSLPESHALRD